MTVGIFGRGPSRRVGGHHDHWPSSYLLPLHRGDCPDPYGTAPGQRHQALAYGGGRSGGSLDPDSWAFFDGIHEHFIPDGDISPVWNPEFFGNTLIANGTTWPYAGVQQRRYRVRPVNKCQARARTLDFSAIPGVGGPARTGAWPRTRRVRPQRHRDLLPGRGDPTSGALHQGRPVRVALSRPGAL